MQVGIQDKQRKEEGRQIERDDNESGRIAMLSHLFIPDGIPASTVMPSPLAYLDTTPRRDANDAPRYHAVF